MTAEAAGAGPVVAADDTDPKAVLAALAGCREPYLIGVRHHSPVLAAAVPSLLAAAAPDVVLVELPAETGPWLRWLADERAVPPVALAASVSGPAEGAGALAFYPFADFSPELAALRWARAHGVEVVPCDLPLALRHAARDADGNADDDGPAAPTSDDAAPDDAAGPDGFAVRSGGDGLAVALERTASGREGDDLWDRLVEAPSAGAAAEEIRRAALLVGWALRRDAETQGVSVSDLRREEWMRARLAEHARDGRRVAVVVGSFHAAALCAATSGITRTDADAQRAVAGEEPEADPSVVTSLVPYAFDLLDARSGYPAGIRDPEWQQAVYEAGGSPEGLTEALTAFAVRVCGGVRAAGHASGPADAREIVRFAGDLATVRGLPAAGRGELVEAAQTVLTHGEPLGRGRVVARAMGDVLVGARTGRLAPGTPRSGLAPAVEKEVADAKLPGAGEPGRQVRLDPLRSMLDRRREVLLQRLAVCQVPYAQPVSLTAIGPGELLSTAWDLAWTPAVEAMLHAVGVHGVTLPQAAQGRLRRRMRGLRDAGGPTPGELLGALDDAVRCGLPALVVELLAEVAATLPAVGTLPELLRGLDLLQRIGRGHVPGLPDPSVLRPGASPPPDGSIPDSPAPDSPAPEGPVAGPLAPLYDELSTAAVRAVDGLTGTNDPEDARALVDLALSTGPQAGGLRLADAVARLADRGSPLISGAAGAVRVLLGQTDDGPWAEALASRLDLATSPEGRTALREHLTGVLTAAAPLLDGGTLDPLLDRIALLPDRGFLDRLPALRGGFDTLSPAARGRLLAVVEERLTAGANVGALDLGTLDIGMGDGGVPGVGPDTTTWAVWAAADLDGREALAAAGLWRDDPSGEDDVSEPSEPGAPRPSASSSLDASVTTTPVPVSPASTTPAVIVAADRWRLILGSPPQDAASRRYGTALDELYGAGRGEGSRRGIGPGNGPGNGGGSGGGREASFPGAREWSDELVALFGPGIREEVLARAAEAGRIDAALALDPDGVRPSFELLHTVLAHAGGLPEHALARLRPLVARLVDELTRELATRLRPSLTGLTHPRPSRRPQGPLDLGRTVRANLATARRSPGGVVEIVPERPVFRTRARRGADWRLVLVVDVSGSMEASTIWAALTAAVLAGVPYVSTHFVAFSTEVIDFTDRVDDPLGLLLEVSVGGGTHIAAGLRYARSLVTVPTRTMVAVVSDFEEGYPIGGLLSEVRALVDAGCHVLGCASLDDTGRARYSVGTAGQLVAAGMPVAALSPQELARWVGEKVR